MSFVGFKGISRVITSLFMVSIGGPVLGELVATMAPLFPEQAALSAEQLGIPFEDVAFMTSDGLLLRGWFFPSEKRGAPAIIYAPSTSSDQRSGMSLVAPFHDAGYHVLLFSYRGHGLSEGNPFGFTYGAMESKDVDAAVRFLHQTKGIRRIGAIGHSAGAVAILMSAARNPHLDAVVAASPFPSMEEVWRTNSPAIIPTPFLELMLRLSEHVRGYHRNQVDPLNVIAKISPRPLMLVHGTEDKRVTMEQALRLFSAAQEPKRMMLAEGADHGEVRTQLMGEMIQEVIAFFHEALGNPRKDRGTDP